MGRGDKRSRRGKISAGSYGNSRNRKKDKARVLRAKNSAGARRKAVKNPKKK